MTEDFSHKSAAWVEAHLDGKQVMPGSVHFDMGYEEGCPTCGGTSYIDVSWQQKENPHPEYRTSKPSRRSGHYYTSKRWDGNLTDLIRDLSDAR